MKRVVMGIDPKYNGFAYTVLEAYSEDGEFYCDYLESGTVLNKGVSEFVAATTAIITSHDIDMIGIEVPGQYGKIGFEGAFLISSAMQIGVIVAAAATHVKKSGKKLPMMLYPAQVQRTGVPGEGWRYYLFGRKTRKNRKQWDEWVKSVLPGFVWNFPGRSNGDVRDSAVIGYALCLAINRRELSRFGCVKPSAYSDYIKSGRKKN